MKTLLYVNILLALLSTCPANARQTLPLSGNDWEIKDTPSVGAEAFCMDWVPATVPGNIQADLEASRYLKPLWYGNGDPRLPEVAHKNWRYRKIFKAPVEFSGKRMTLVFDGVDFACEVWLNDIKLGENSGMFKRFRFDSTDAVRPGQVNILEVRIAGMPEELHDVFPTADDPGGANVQTVNTAMRRNLKEIKSATNCAYDWAFAVYTLGIWKDVRLEATDSVHIDNLGVLPALNHDYTNADLRVLIDVDSLEEIPVTISISAACHDSKAATIIGSQITKGQNHLEIPLSLSNPLLWWPLGHGEHPLYDLRVEISHSDNGSVLDAQSVRFGIREVSWQQVPGAPADFINPMKLVINGRPIRQMGSNLLPPDILFGRMNESGLRLLDQAHYAGINCLRLWGGGVILSDAMYDRADDLGIMLMQEFPLANTDPEVDPVFLANLKATAVNVIKQVRNHPSIIEWTGGNEMPTWTQGSTNPAMLVLLDAVREHDNRFFRATEPAQGSGPHGSYTYVYHTKPVPHIFWLGAAGQTLYQRYNTSSEMRLSEFGTNSPANLEVWQRTIPPASQWPLSDYNDPVLIRKNVFWGALIKENWLHRELTEDIFGPLDRLEQLVPAGQFLGAEGLRYAMDALRCKGDAIGGGFMSWNYNEPWPNGAGSYMVDYDGRPLMNYYFTKQALAPVSLCLKYDSLLFDPAIGVSAELLLVSDAPRPVDAVNWQWLARDRRGHVFARGQGTAAIAQQQVVDLGALSLKPSEETARGPIFVEMQLIDSTGKRLTERLHVFGARGFEAPLAGLLDQTPPDVDDNAPPEPTATRKPDDPIDPKSPENLAYVGNGSMPATASSARPEPYHQPSGLNNGQYGNSESWIGITSQSWFEIDLTKTVRIGQFRLGRDRTFQYADRGLHYLKIETSTDHTHWQTVFERSHIMALKGFNPNHTMIVDVAPVEARWVRATVDPQDPQSGGFVCIDEFEIYAPQRLEIGADSADPDSDGQNNLAEYTAGTDPKNGRDFFRITSTSRADGRFAVTTSGKSGRKYYLEQSPTLGEGTWTSVTTLGPLASDATIELADPAPAASAGFYRIRVELP